MTKSISQVRPTVIICTGQGWCYKSRWSLISRNGLFAGSHHAAAISKLLSKSAAINQTMVLLHIDQVSTIPDFPRWSFCTWPPPSPPPLPCCQCWSYFLSLSNLLAIPSPTQSGTKLFLHNHKNYLNLPWHVSGSCQNIQSFSRRSFGPKFMLYDAFSRPQQGRIDFNTVNPSLSIGMDLLIHP